MFRQRFKTICYEVIQWLLFCRFDKPVFHLFVGWKSKQTRPTQLPSLGKGNFAGTSEVYPCGGSTIVGEKIQYS